MGLEIDRPEGHVSPATRPLLEGERSQLRLIRPKPETANSCVVLADISSPSSLYSEKINATTLQIVHVRRPLITRAAPH